MTTHSGGCLCGNVRFAATAPLREVIFCHCSQCRRQTGSHVAATSVPDERLSIDGSDDVTWFAASASARRGFCRHCGSLLFWKPLDEARTSIMAGAFDDPSVLTAGPHIFVDGAAPWDRIAP
jgi:hypothetical protein